MMAKVSKGSNAWDDDDHSDVNDDLDDDENIRIVDDNYFSDNVSVLCVNNSDSSNSRDLVHGFDQLSVPHHFVPG